MSFKFLKPQTTPTSLQECFQLWALALRSLRSWWPSPWFAPNKTPSFLRFVNQEKKQQLDPLTLRGCCGWVAKIEQLFWGWMAPGWAASTWFNQQGCEHFVCVCWGWWVLFGQLQWKLWKLDDFCLTLEGTLQFPGGPLSQINKKSWNRVTMQPAGMFQNIGPLQS